MTEKISKPAHVLVRAGVWTGKSELDLHLCSPSGSKWFRGHSRSGAHLQTETVSDSEGDVQYSFPLAKVFTNIVPKLRM